MKAGLRQWGGRAREQEYAKVKHLILDVFIPMHPEELNYSGKGKALNVHCFTIEEKDGRIKEIRCMRRIQ
jgi:hypothetical protein